MTASESKQLSIMNSLINDAVERIAGEVGKLARYNKKGNAKRRTSVRIVDESAREVLATTSIEKMTTTSGILLGYDQAYLAKMCREVFCADEKMLTHELWNNCTCKLRAKGHLLRPCVSRTCMVCGENFPSRSKLFKHLHEREHIVTADKTVRAIDCCMAGDFEAAGKWLHSSCTAEQSVASIMHLLIEKRQEACHDSQHKLLLLGLKLVSHCLRSGTPIGEVMPHLIEHACQKRDEKMVCVLMGKSPEERLPKCEVCNEAAIFCAPMGELHTLPLCGHQCCPSSIASWLKVKIEDGATFEELCCPVCLMPMDANEARQHAGDALERLERNSMECLISSMADYHWCPRCPAGGFLGADINAGNAGTASSPSRCLAACAGAGISEVMRAPPSAEELLKQGGVDLLEVLLTQAGGSVRAALRQTSHSARETDNNLIQHSGQGCHSCATCRECNHCFCTSCKQPWSAMHTWMTCSQYKVKSTFARNAYHDDLSEEWLKENCRDCPNCGIAILKEGGCSHMTCQRCRFEFCWLCMGPYQRKYFTQDQDAERTGKCPCGNPLWFREKVERMCLL